MKIKLILSSLVLFILTGCSTLSPPEPPEPKGELKPINIVSHKEAYSDIKQPVLDK